MADVVLEPKTVDELSRFIDCMQLTHPEQIEELSNPALIQQIGHELYDEVVRLKSLGLL